MRHDCEIRKRDQKGITAALAPKQLVRAKPSTKEVRLNFFHCNFSFFRDKKKFKKSAPLKEKVT